MNPTQIPDNKFINSLVLDLNNSYFDPLQITDSRFCICLPTTGPTVDLEALVSEMRNAAIWSSQEPRWLAPSERETIKHQYILVAAHTVHNDNCSFKIARFDRQPSAANDQIWNQWLEFFDRHFKPGADES